MATSTSAPTASARQLGSRGSARKAAPFGSLPCRTTTTIRAATTTTGAESHPEPRGSWWSAGCATRPPTTNNGRDNTTRGGGAPPEPAGGVGVGVLPHRPPDCVLPLASNRTKL